MWGGPPSAVQSSEARQNEPATSAQIQLGYWTGGTLILFARQSFKFWHAAGCRSFVMHTDTAVKLLLPQLTVISSRLSCGFACTNASFTSAGVIKTCSDGPETSRAHEST